MEKKTCCICGKQFEGYGNNPHPVRKSGECCNDCNQDFVIPERIRLITQGGNNEK